MLKQLLISFVLAGVSFVAFAAEPDSSILVVNATTNIDFEWNSKLSKVEVKQKDVINYLAEGYDATIPVSEFYNDNVKINQVSCSVNGVVPFGFKPEYSYYSEDNIFYSDARICYFPIYLKEKGKKATTTFVKTTDDPRYFCNVFFTEPYRIKYKEIIVSIPRWMKLDVKEMNFNPNISKSVRYDKRDDADIITYTAINLNPQKHEIKSPGPTYLYPHLLFLPKSASHSGTTLTYFNNLADQYSWYHTIAQPSENKDVVKAKAEEITAGITDDLKKIKKVFYWVQDNIRYIAFEDGIAGLRPDKADEVLRKKYGDCKGMANLTKHLLVSLGFDARLCWLGTNHIAYDYSTPSMAVDNHMICAVNFKGKTHFLDATETYLPFNEYAERIQGRQVLIEDGEKHILAKIPATSASQNYDYEKRVLNINASILSGTVTHAYKGEEKEYMFTRLHSFKQNEYEKALTKFLTNSNDNTLEKLNISDLKNYEDDLKISYTITQKSGISVFDKEYYIEMDLRKEFGDFTIDTDTRKSDYWHPYKHNIQRETELTIPENYQVSSLPENLSIKTPDYEIAISYSQEPGKVFYKKSFVIKNPRISKSRFAQWNADIKKLNTAYNETLILKPKS